MIRPYADPDAKECSELFIETIHTSNTHFSKQDLLDLDHYFRVENIAVIAEKTRLYVYEVDQVIVATGALSKQNYLSLMYVLPEYQKRGIGNEMMQFLLNLAGDGPIECNATELAVPFYEKYGFEQVREICYPHDEGDGELCFTRMKLS